MENKFLQFILILFFGGSMVLLGAVELGKSTDRNVRTKLFESREFVRDLHGEVPVDGSKINKKEASTYKRDALESEERKELQTLLDGL